MPEYVVRRIQAALNREKNALNGSRIIILCCPTGPTSGTPASEDEAATQADIRPDRKPCHLRGWQADPLGAWATDASRDQARQCKGWPPL